MPKDPKSPATTSLSYDVMAPKWAKISTLLGGTETMRAAGIDYLPQHPAETGNAYQHRLSVTTLLNMVDMTLTSLTARPFSSSIIVGEDVPEEIKKILDDVDQQGTCLDRFARAWFREGVAKGYSAVLVEFPRLPVGDAPRTLADDAEQGLRPYLVHIVPENILSADSVIINGQEVLTEVRIREEVVEKRGFSQEVVVQIRVLRPGTGEVFREVRVRGKSVWKSVESYTYDLDFIPLVIYYSDRQGFMLSKPPLLDLANLNIRHFQSTSDQIAILTVSRFPMLAVSGSAETDLVVVGPNTLLSVTDPTGRFYYVEHTGRAINVGRQDLLDIEELMANYGATFLKKRPTTAPATTRVLDSAEVTSALQDMALGFQDCLNQVMYFVGLWMDKDKAGTFKVKTDFSPTESDDSGLTALGEARKNRDISRTNYLKNLIRYGVLSEDFPIVENDAALLVEHERLVSETSDLSKAEAPPAPKPVADSG